MNNPIVEKLQMQIQDSRTAEYFSEVLSCYYSGNLRSAVVMLYATVICDLVYKLEDLKNVYGDNGARKILEELELRQKANPKDTDWEREIPEKCKGSNKILTTADYSNFCSLQQLRHLCAHPVITENKELYRPNSDIVLGHIRNMLDGVLTKPAFQIKELFKILIDDVASIKTVLVEESKLEKYVVSKYLDKFNSVELELHIFKNLWKFVFALDDVDCEENREANYYVLTLLVRRHKDRVFDLITKNQQYFANHIDCHKHRTFVLFIKFLNKFPDCFSILPESKRLEINAVVDKDQVYDYQALALFRCSDVIEHIMNDTLKSDHSSLLYLAHCLEFMAGHAVALEYYIRLYGASGNYNKADNRFKDFIAPYILDFTEAQLLSIIEATEGNGQVYGGYYASFRNEQVKNRMLELNDDFDFSKYPHFM